MVSWFKLGEWKLVEEDKKIMLGEVVKKDMSVMEVAWSLTSNRIEWWKRRRVADSD